VIVENSREVELYMERGRTVRDERESVKVVVSANIIVRIRRLNWCINYGSVSCVVNMF